MQTLLPSISDSSAHDNGFTGSADVLIIRVGSSVFHLFFFAFFPTTDEKKIKGKSGLIKLKSNWALIRRLEMSSIHHNTRESEERRETPNTRSKQSNSHETHDAHASHTTDNTSRYTTNVWILKKLITWLKKKKRTWLFQRMTT